MNNLLAVGCTLILASTASNICIEYTEISNMGGFDHELVSEAEELIKMVSVQGWFYDIIDGAPGALISLEFYAQYETGQECPGCTWTMKGDHHDQATSSPITTIGDVDTVR